MVIDIFVKNFDIIPSEVNTYSTAKLHMNIFVTMYQYTSSYSIIIEQGMDTTEDSKVSILDKMLQNINTDTFKNRIDFTSDGDIPAKSDVILSTFIPVDITGYLILKQYFFGIKEEILHSMI